ncbi:hypothetical protein C8J57DRAFT_1251659 [Mycena rebaudengoi]|nr:hypothetical protein C8J57DRAFT_1251659 [Mycena rebaudengoi]
MGGQSSPKSNSDNRAVVCKPPPPRQKKLGRESNALELAVRAHDLGEAPLVERVGASLEEGEGDDCKGRGGVIAEQAQLDPNPRLPSAGECSIIHGEKPPLRVREGGPNQQALLFTRALRLTYAWVVHLHLHRKAEG